MCTDVIIRNTTQVSVKKFIPVLENIPVARQCGALLFQRASFRALCELCGFFSLASRHHIRQFMAVGGGRVLMMWYARNIGAIIALLNNACGHDGAIAVKCRRGAEIRRGGRVVGMAR